MPVVIGFDRHPASRAALRFAGDLAGALNVHLHVVHVMDIADGTVDAETTGSAGGKDTGDRDRAAAILDAANVSWTYHVMDGDPADVLLRVASKHAASMIVVGRPEQGIGAALGHIVTGAVARTLIRRSERPVVVVPDIADSLR